VSGGTRLTAEYVGKHGKPCLVMQLDREPRIEETLSWIKERGIKILNVAGPRESKRPGIIYRQALAYLRELFASQTFQEMDK
jgi:hypothetical protein